MFQNSQSNLFVCVIWVTVVVGIVWYNNFKVSFNVCFGKVVSFCFAFEEIKSWMFGEKPERNPMELLYDFLTILILNLRSEVLTFLRYSKLTLFNWRKPNTKRLNCVSVCSWVWFFFCNFMLIRLFYGFFFFNFRFCIWLSLYTLIKIWMSSIRKLTLTANMLQTPSMNVAQIV